MDFERKVQEILQHPPEDPESRKRLIDAAHTLIEGLNPLHIQVQSLAFNNLKVPLLATAADLRILQTLGNESGQAYNPNELASVTGCSPVLALRMLRYLATNRIIQQTSTDTWKGTLLTQELAKPGNINAIWHLHYNCGPAFQAIPSYLSQRSYTQPDSVTNCPFSLGHNSPDTFWFDWLSQRPTNLSYFTEYLANQAGTNIFTLPSISSRILALPPTKNDRSNPIFIDIGGSTGQTCIDLLTAIPSLPETTLTINTDLAFVIANALPHPQVQHIPHDFFTPLPTSLLNSRIYFLRAILHDFSDAKCATILRHLTAALDHSTEHAEIWINEQIVPDEGASEYSVNMDLAMLSMVGGMERTRHQWDALLTGVGLEIRDVVLVSESLSLYVIIAALPGQG